MIKTIVVLVYLSSPSSAWKGQERIEYEMPDMATCLQAVSSAKVSTTDKGSVAVFCAYKKA